MDVQWYPGHMTKARRMMEENIRLVDLVIELVDARIPMSSRNPDIDALCRGKGRIVLLCKSDLADPEKTEAFLAFFREKGFLAVAADARERKAGEVVRRYVQEACREKLAKDRTRGIIGRPLRAMVAGIPNVGKSTFINSFAGRASTKTGNKPGVTRGKQWIRLGDGVELLDTPGILWPKFEDPAIGIRLALAGAIRDEVLDREELAIWLLQYLETEYPGVVRGKYLSGKRASGSGPDAEFPDRLMEAESAAADETEPVSTGETEPVSADEAGAPETAEHAGYALLLEIARARRLLKKGGEPDAERAAAMLIDDCRNGRIGRISLDLPREAEAMMQARESGSRDASSPREEAGTGSRRKNSSRNTGGENTGGRTGRGKNSERRTAPGKPASRRQSPQQKESRDRGRSRTRNSGRKK